LFSDPTFMPSVLMSGRAHRYVCAARSNSSSSLSDLVVSAVGRFSTIGLSARASWRSIVPAVATASRLNLPVSNARWCCAGFEHETAATSVFAAHTTRRNLVVMNPDLLSGLDARTC
jgi:hypothetical protein